MSDFHPPGDYKNGVWFGENVSLSDNCTIIPPVVIGSNVQIKEKSTIGPYTVIHDNVTIDENVTVDHSVIWEKAELEAESFIQNSVISNDVKIGKSRRIINYSAIE